jgi:Arc/MetJ-type ribon-helix-helix transcriptional regulator
MVGKRRLSVSVDAKLVEAAEQAVKRGEAPTLSAYVSEGLKRQLENDKRLRAMREAIREYERELGKITAEDIAEAERAMQSRAIHVRPRRPYEAKVEASQTASRASERRSRR